jgi:hypothetical protein
MVDDAMAAAAAAGPKWARPRRRAREVIRQMCAAIEGGFQAIDEVASAEKGHAGAAARRGTRPSSASTSPTNPCPSTSSKTPTTAR